MGFEVKTKNKQTKSWDRVQSVLYNCVILDGLLNFSRSYCTKLWGNIIQRLKWQTLKSKYWILILTAN